MMKNALFALAALLLLIGGICVITGSLAIDTERGWTSVISGTTLVVGSGVILALAWTIKTLEQIHELLQNGGVPAAVAALMPKQDALRREPAGVAAEETDPAPLAWPPHTSPLPPPAPASVVAKEAVVAESVEQNRRETFASEAEEIVSAPLDERPVPEPAKAQTSFKDMWRRVGKQAEAKPPRPAAPPPIPTPISAPIPVAMDKPPRPPMFGAKPSPTSATPPSPPPAAPPSPPPAPLGAVPPPPPPPMHQVEFTAEQNDWLDHALAELDSAIAETPFARHPEATPEAPAAAVPPAPAFARRVEAEKPEKPPANKAPTEPAEEKSVEAAPPLAEDTEPATELASLAQEPAVIGRYEAEGTTYVMFADGSIEAQSERGVARFKSMADLKAYFETQEAP